MGFQELYSFRLVSEIRNHLQPAEKLGLKNFMALSNMSTIKSTATLLQM
jgi:hypothetical protein